MSDILVTGSKGVVGSYLMSMLAAKGHRVFGIDLQHSVGEIGWEQEMAKTDFTYARCDVSDFRQLERVFENAGPFDFVYHTAAEFGRWNGEDYYEQVWRTNAIGTKRHSPSRKLSSILFIFIFRGLRDFEDVMKEEVMIQSR